jgi:phosphoglycerate dehydrogenase-like enzyme
MVRADGQLRRGAEREMDSYGLLMGVPLRGKILGIVGVGNMGTRVAVIAGSSG